MRGFTLFYALLVSSLALTIGAAIFDITLREIDLSNTVSQSQFAVYVSDSGAECALFWDNHYLNNATNNNGSSTSAFASSSADTLAPGVNSGLNCGGVDVSSGATWIAPSVPSGTLSATAATTTFTITGVAYRSNTPCAIVTIAKYGNPSQTTVTSHGYNTCTAGPQQLERVFQVTY